MRGRTGVPAQPPPFLFGLPQHWQQTSSDLPLQHRHCPGAPLTFLPYLCTGTEPHALQAHCLLSARPIYARNVTHLGVRTAGRAHLCAQGVEGLLHWEPSYHGGKDSWTSPLKQLHPGTTSSVRGQMLGWSSPSPSISCHRMAWV